MSDARLKTLAERIERLMDERDGIQGDIRDIYTEAKSAGYVPKVLRKAITRKRMDVSKRDEEDAILELYEGALSGPMRRAVQMAASGKTSREIEKETGIDHATVSRSVALNKKSATKPETADLDTPPGGDQGTADVTTAQPEVAADPIEAGADAPAADSAAVSPLPSTPRPSSEAEIARGSISEPAKSLYQRITGAFVDPPVDRADIDMMAAHDRMQSLMAAKGRA